jgi:hypothetical protein
LASGLELKLSYDGMHELLNSRGVQRDLSARARRVADRAGPGFRTFVSAEGIGTVRTSHRARGMVWTATFAAEARNRTLTRAIDAARG